MDHITPDDRPYAEEFRRQPIGNHSPGLQKVLNIMRNMYEVKGAYCLVATKPFREWVLARRTGVRDDPLEILDDQVFHNLDEAEWHVFKLRWKAHVDEDLDEVL